MAEPIAPRAARAPMTIVARDTVGWIMQTWQPPADGWTPLDEPQRFATDKEAGDAAAPIVGAHNGTLAMLMFPPGYRAPDFGRRK
jgi:hypothetical protein